MSAPGLVTQSDVGVGVGERVVVVDVDVEVVFDVELVKRAYYKAAAV